MIFELSIEFADGNDVIACFNIASIVNFVRRELGEHALS